MQPQANIVPHASNNIAGPPEGRAQSLYSSSIGLLIADLAADMEPLPTLLSRYKLSKPQFQALLANDTFRNAIKAQRSLHQAASNLPHRIQLKAQLAVEELMGDMIAITSNPSQPGAARVAAYSKLQALTGLERPEAPQPKPKFSLVLNIATNPNNPNEVLEIKGEIDEAVEAGEETLNGSSAENISGLTPEPEGRISRSSSGSGSDYKGGWRAGLVTPAAQLKNPPRPFERKSVSIIGLQQE